MSKIVYDRPALRGLTEAQIDNEDRSKRLLLLGGYSGLEKALRTNYTSGISGTSEDSKYRTEVFGTNAMPEGVLKSWFELFCSSFLDPTLLVLIAMSFVSLGVGFIEDPKTGWIEGAAILAAVLLVATVTATNDYSKAKQFQKLSAANDDVNATVARNGISTSVNVKDLLVGDIVLLNAGDKIPADGIFVTGSDVKCNESNLTGEPDDITKTTNGSFILFSGSTVSSGYCRMLVTAVGVETVWGQIKSKLSSGDEVRTPLQEKLEKLADDIGKLGTAVSVLTFAVLIVMYYVRPADRPLGVDGKTMPILKFVMKAFIMSLTIVVVAVPEGLPLAVTLSLAYSSQKMMKDNSLIRVLAACETMGNATTICSDKTGTLTQNRMTVVEGWFAGSYFNGVPKPSDLPVSVVEAIIQNSAVNATAILIKNEVTNEMVVTGSKTEGALLLFIKSAFNADYVPLRASGFDATRGDVLYTFSSARKRMSVLCFTTAKKTEGVVYTKGASEVVLGLCVSYIDSKGKVVSLTAAVKNDILATIEKMAKMSLRTVACAHKTITGIKGSVEADVAESGLILDCIVGIKDPLRPDVIQAVKECQRAGIFVRMVTGDNIETAKAIAAECGILTEGGMAIEGPDFRKLSPSEADKIIPKLQVMARSSPNDKYVLVSRLNGHDLPETAERWSEKYSLPVASFDREKNKLLPGYKEEWAATRTAGEVVGVTGDGTNDAPALKAADVGLSMGLSGTEVAKGASDIVIMDDNFSSIVKAVMWGRAVFDNIRKFLQFQLTVNLVALSITFISVLTGYEPPLNAVMMLWVNMIMDTMGALALGTEPPNATLLHRKPYTRNASLISNKMWRNIICQYLFQMILLAYLLLWGEHDFEVKEGSPIHMTIIFNTFVFCQIFNEINARSIGDEMNVFNNLLSAQSTTFIFIIMFTCVGQWFIVEYGGLMVKTVPLNADQWYRCILLGAISLPVGGLMRLVRVNDSEADYAVISPLMEKSYNAARSSPFAFAENSVSLSFILWFAAVGAIPALVFQEFGSQWVVHANDLIAAYFNK